ncbi:MAG TPA: M56 family metallopeptidase [Planctomycetaceae bacterium]|nr:M56 family metallopeptidase [Planctomycetaceae bacterium]
MISLFLERYALWFAAGTTALLLTGCLVLSLQRSPAHRQRTGELTILALLAWLLLAGLPLPRFLPQWHWPKAAAYPQTSREFTTQSAPRLETSVVELDPSEELEALAALVEARDQRTTDSETRLPTAEPATVLDAAPEPREHHPSLTASMAWVYCAGVLFCLLWLVAGALRLWWILFTAHRPPTWLASLYESLGLPASKARLLITRYDIRPLSCGLMRSVILLPRKLVRRRKAELLRMILLHELAHVERRDGWGHALLCFALPLLYGHPLYWWLRRQYRMAAELLADSWAAYQVGTLPYVEQLISLAGTLSPHAVPNAALAVFSSPSQFFRRMEMLMQRQVPLDVSISRRWRVMSMVVLSVIVWMGAEIAGSRPAVGQEESASEAEVSYFLRNGTLYRRVLLLSDSADRAKADDQSMRPDATPVIPAATTYGIQEEAPAREGNSKGDVPAEKLAEPRPDGLTTETQPKTPFPGRVAQDGEKPVQSGFVSQLQAQIAAQQLAGDQVTEEKLRDEIVAIERQLNALRERLKLLQQPRRLGVVFPQAGEHPNATVQVTRVREDGALITEVWAVDADGKPTKLISKGIQTRGEDSPIAQSRTEVEDGRVIKEYKRRDGSAVLHVYDRNTGKLLETQEGEAPAAKSGKRRLAAATENFAPGQQRGASDRDGLGIDLVALAAAYADAVSDLEAAQSDFATTATLAAEGRASGNEKRTAQVAVDRAARKQRALHAILTVAVEDARAKVKYLHNLKQTGYASQDAVVEAETRYKMLDAILQSGPADAKSTGTKGRPVEDEGGGAGKEAAW